MRYNSVGMYQSVCFEKFETVFGHRCITDLGSIHIWPRGAENDWRWDT